jgi:hypothetical protein
MNAEMIRMRLAGTRPLLMHSAKLADPLDPASRQLARLTAKRPKTEADHAEIARVEWFGGLWLAGGAPCIPPEALEATFLSAARSRRRGKAALAGILIEEPAPLLYEGPQDLDELWSDETFRLRVPVRIGPARTMRTRPRFPAWSVEFDVKYLPTLLNRSEVRETFVISGFTCALGDWRPRYGTFSAVEVK